MCYSIIVVFRVLVIVYIGGFVLGVVYLRMVEIKVMLCYTWFVVGGFVFVLSGFLGSRMIFVIFRE